MAAGDLGQRRRQDLDRHATLNGIDVVEVLDRDAIGPIGPIASLPIRQRTLLARCFKPVAGLGADNVLVQGGVRVQGIEVLWAHPADAVPVAAVPRRAERALYAALPSPEEVLVVRTDAAGDFSTYRLRLVASAASGDLRPPGGYDVRLSEAPLAFKAECPSPFDCVRPEAAPARQAEEPAIDYLVKDYASFRRLMLDRLSALMPGWTERNPADVGVTIVEALAHAADEASYYQDAVATEAYLGTARRRVSLRRHARLLDYRVHEGCNARAWVHVAFAGPAVTLPAGTLLLTRSAAPPGALGEQQAAEALAQGAPAFETLHDLRLQESHGEIALHDWGEPGLVLPAGTTSLALADPHASPLDPLEPGDVLVVEEVRSPVTGRPEDADPGHRHAVRLVSVQPGEDTLYELPLVLVEWEAEDALPFDLHVVDAVVRGNMVLADHGRTVPEEPVRVEGGPRDVPRLGRRHVTHRVPYRHRETGVRPASARAALRQDPRRALPQVELHDGREHWAVAVAGDLLQSGRFDRAFVVEMEEDGRAQLRFGDNVSGRRPAAGSVLRARYRVGNGTAGNVGAEAIANAVTRVPGIIALRNPLPAHGGTDPESLERVRISAPQAFRRQERAITSADWAAAAETHPEVQRAAATMRWTGAWQTAFVTVDRRGGRPVDAGFAAELRAWLEPYRLAGQELEVDGPRFVALDIAFTVCVAPDRLRDTVRRALDEIFSNRDLPDGRRGQFHPDELSFGEPVYLSPLVAAVMAVPGVVWVDTDDTPPKPNRFRRSGATTRRELEEGVIRIGRLEIARLDNDPSAPENGAIELVLQGGM